MNEANYNKDWIEAQLAHSERNKSRGSYNHAKYLQGRRKMMGEWASLIESLSRTNVVPIGSAARFVHALGSE